MGRYALGHIVLCPLQATLNPRLELFLGSRVWPWGLQTGNEGVRVGASYQIPEAHGMPGRTHSPTGQSRLGKESRVEVEGQGAWAEAELGWGCEEEPVPAPGFTGILQGFVWFLSTPGA